APASRAEGSLYSGGSSGHASQWRWPCAAASDRDRMTHYSGVEHVRLSVVIMSHPSRSDYAEALAARLKVPIVYDPEPDEERNPWRCARQAWKVASSKQGATHAM